MSFQSVEISDYNAKPIELYAFMIGSTPYRFTNVAKEQVITGTSVDQTIGGITMSANGTYVPAIISMSELEDTPNPEQLAADFLLTRDNPVALAFRSAPPGFVLPVMVWRKHASDPEVVKWFKGDIVSCSLQESRATINAEPPLAKAARLGNQQRYQYQCNKTTYSERCGVDVADFTFNVVIDDINGNVITLTALPGGAASVDGYFTGGYMTAPDGTVRFITMQDNLDLDLMLTFDAGSIAIGNTVQITAGDDRMPETCRDKFFAAGDSGNPEGNIANFFGFFTRPARNPWKQGGLASAGATGFANNPDL
jgi:Phage conserved hypothetical protein BR0599.